MITEDTVNCYNIWDHFFTKEALISELQPIGFSPFELYGDIAGKEFSDTGETICGVFTKLRIVRAFDCIVGYPTTNEESNKTIHKSVPFSSF